MIRLPFKPSRSGSFVLKWQKCQRVVQAYLLLPWVALRLKRNGYQHTLVWCYASCRGDGGQSADDAIQQARSMAHIVAMASRYGPYRANCLGRSLVLLRMLGPAGIKAKLVLGAKPVQGQLKAHAWVQFG